MIRSGRPKGVGYANSAQRVFYYDGGCGFCTSVVRVLTRVDLFHRITWIPYQSLERPPEGLSWEDLDRSAYLETGRGGNREGFQAFRGLTLHLLPLWPLAPFLWLPGVPHLGTAVYRWIARNRYRVSQCRLLLPGGPRGRRPGGGP